MNLGLGLLLGAVALSALSILHDLRSGRIAQECPQAAPSRLPPELDLLAGMLGAAGVGMLFGAGWAALTFVVQVGVGVWKLLRES